MQACSRSYQDGPRARLALVFVSAVLAFPALELGYRIHLHRPVLVLDDWRAGRMEARAFGEQGAYDPALGWVPKEDYEGDGYNTLDSGIRRNFCEKEVRTGGVLAVGDVFTNGGSEVDDGETWPAHLERITGTPVLNGGVAGYGVDQIILRAEQLLPQAQPKTLVVGLLEEAIARAGLSSFGASKPYYTLNKGELVYYAPGPIRTGQEGQSGWTVTTRSLLGHSAVLDMVLSRLAPTYWYGKAGEQVTRAIDNDPVGVTCALLERLKRRADSDGARVLLLMQHAQRTVVERTEPGESAKKVAACAASMGIEVVDQFEALRSIVAAKPEALADLYAQGGGFGEMSSEGNRHAAELLARALSK